MASGSEASSPFFAGIHSAGSEPTKASDAGYFPSTPQSVASSSSSADSVPDFSLRLQQTGRSTTTPATSSSRSRAAQLDALSREYPAPPQEISVEEMLARPPQKWSLSHYVKNAREARTPVLDKQQQGREFEVIKRELLAAKEQMKELGTGGR